MGKAPEIVLLRGGIPLQKGVELLERKELDVLIVSDYDAGKDYYCKELKTLERVLLIPRDHPVCRKEYAGLEDLKEEPLVLSINDPAFDRLMDFLAEHGCRPDEVLRGSDTLCLSCLPHGS